jgi:hypothetical protein
MGKIIGTTAVEMFRWGEAGLVQDMDLVSAFLFTPDIMSSLDAAALEA